MNRLLALKPSVLYSGHGPVITDPQTQITTYLQHRKNRENQVIEVLTQRERATVRDIVSTIYGVIIVIIIITIKLGVLLLTYYKQFKIDRG